MQVDGNFSLGLLCSLIVLGLFLARARKTIFNVLVTGVAILVILLISTHWGVLAHLQLFVGDPAHHGSLKKASAVPTEDPLVLIFLVSVVLGLALLACLKFLYNRRSQKAAMDQVWFPCAQCGESGYHRSYYPDYSVDRGEGPQKLCFECAQTLQAIALPASF